jgi:hypothetical protein
MSFDLRPVYTKTVIDHIAQLTAQTSNDYITQVLSRLAYRHDILQKPTIFGYLPAPTDVDLLKQIIGYRGHYLKLTTANTEVDLIWHDRAQNMFLFWSSSNYKAVRAMSILSRRINKYLELEYADMPELISDDGQVPTVSVGQFPDHETGVDLH